MIIYNDPEVDRILYIFNPVTEKKDDIISFAPWRIKGR